MFALPRKRPPPPSARPEPPENSPARPPRIPRWLAAVLFAGALGAAWWRMPQPAAPALPLPTTAAPSALPARFTTTLIPSAGAPAEPTLTLLPDGRLAAAWSANSPDEAEQRAIWFSIENPAGWRAPQLAASRESTAAGTFTHAGDLGAPLLHAEGGWLHLWYASRDGLAGASLNHSVSTNGGQAWTKPEKAEISPLAAGDLRFGPPPVALDDGGLGLTLFRSFVTGHGSWLHLSATGRILGLQRLPDHPAGGPGWPSDAARPVGTAASRPALLRLASGRLLLAGNPVSGRAALQLWLSADAGRSWQSSRTVEEAADGAADFGEPALLLGHDGRIHLAYRWRRQGIKVASFSEAWLAGERP